MFDFLKTLTKSDEAKRQEAFSAYLDGSLPVRQQQEFEQRLAEDADLRAEMELAQALRQHMQEMPRRSLPRSFTLEASLYGKPQKEPLVQAYPFLRAATVLTAFFFVIALGLSVFTTNQGMDAQNVADMTSMAQSAREAAPVMEAPAAEVESFGEEVAAETAAAKIVEETVMVETVVEEAAVAEEAMVEEAPQGAALSATMDAEATAVPEMEAAAALPAATVSSLPRPAATETAVPRLGEAAEFFSDDAAGNVAAEMSQPVPTEAPHSTRGLLPLSQWLLLSLALLFFFLLTATLLAHRKR